MRTNQKLKEIFAKAFELPTESITDDLEYQGIAEWDSMSHLVLVTEIEAAYDVKIPMGDILEMGSIHKVKEILIKNGVKLE